MSILIGACAPKTTPITHGKSMPLVGPQVSDTDLKVNGSQAISELDWSANVTAAVVYRMTENLYSIKDGLSEKSRQLWTKRILRDLPQAHTKLVDSPYFDLLIQQSEKLAAKQIEQLVTELSSSPLKVRHIIANLGPLIGENEHITFEQIIVRVFSYLRKFDGQIGNSDLLVQIKAALHDQLQKIYELEVKARANLDLLNSSKTITSLLETILAIAKEFSVEIPSESLAKMSRGQALGKSIDLISDPHSALFALIDLWFYLSAQGALADFKIANEQLYNYLDGMAEEDLRCLQSSECGSLPKLVARKLFIEPKIEAYGVEKIRNLINERGVTEIRSQLLTAVVGQIRNIPDLIGQQFELALRKSIVPIVHLKTNFRGEIHNRLDDWAKKNFEVNGPSVSKVLPANAYLRVNNNGQVKIDWIQLPGGTLENSGALDGIAPILWNEKGQNTELVRGLVLEKISTLALLYKGGSGLFPADFQSVSARAYAEVVRGLASLANSFKEWTSSPVDKLIGEVKAKDLFPEFSSLSALDQLLFPKDAFYALSFFGLSENLLSAQSDRTQIFLIDAHNHIIRANHPSSDQDVPVIMAGIADRNGTELSPTVRSEDVSRYLLAMCDVYEATKEVESTKSKILLEPDIHGNIPRDLILQSREKIRLLILGLANFLSHQFRSGGEFIHDELDIATQLPIGPTITVMDQAIAIRALVAASEMLGNDVYRWEAEDLVMSMNRYLYRQDLGFYARSNERGISPSVLLETLRALDAVSPHLSDPSRVQIEKLSAPWRKKISAWHIVSPN